MCPEKRHSRNTKDMRSQRLSGEILEAMEEVISDMDADGWTFLLAARIYHRSVDEGMKGSPSLAQVCAVIADKYVNDSGATLGCILDTMMSKREYAELERLVLERTVFSDWKMRVPENVKDSLESGVSYVDISSSNRRRNSLPLGFTE